MPYIIQENFKTETAIFVILFPAQNSFYVGKTPVSNLRKTYGNHYYEQIKKTQEFFHKAKMDNINPPIYCLETIEVTDSEAKLYCIAWAKYFVEQGLSSLCGSTIDKYTIDLRSEAQAIYESIKDKSIEQVCITGTDLFPKFGNERVKRNKSERNMITFRVQNSEYQQVKKAADETSLSISEYCKKQILNGRVINIDNEIFTLFSEYLNAFTVRNQLLKQILSAIYRTNRYTAADLKVIQDTINDNRDMQREIIAEINSIIKLLTDN